MKISKSTLYNKLQVLAADLRNPDDSKFKYVELDVTGNTLALCAWNYFGQEGKIGTDFIATSVEVESTKDFSVTVNLFELFSTIDVCDDWVELSIDKKGLNVSSMMNGVGDYYEFNALIMGIPVHHSLAEIASQMGESVGQVKLSSTQLLSIKNDFTYDVTAEELIFSQKDNRMTVGMTSKDGYTMSVIDFDSGIDIVGSPSNFVMDYSTFDLIHGIHAIATTSDFSDQYLKVYENYVQYSAGGYDLISKICREQEGVLPVALTEEQYNDDSLKIGVVEPIEVAGALDMVIRAMKEDGDNELMGEIIFDSTKGYAVIEARSMNDKCVKTLFHIDNESDYGIVECYVNLRDFHNIVKLTGTQYLMIRNRMSSADDRELILDYRNAIFTKTARIFH